MLLGRVVQREGFCLHRIFRRVSNSHFAAIEVISNGIIDDLPTRIKGSVGGLVPCTSGGTVGIVVQCTFGSGIVVTFEVITIACRHRSRRHGRIKGSCCRSSTAVTALLIEGHGICACIPFSIERCVKRDVPVTNAGGGVISIRLEVLGTRSVLSGVVTSEIVTVTTGDIHGRSSLSKGSRLGSITACTALRIQSDGILIRCPVCGVRLVTCRTLGDLHGCLLCGAVRTSPTSEGITRTGRILQGERIRRYIVTRRIAGYRTAVEGIGDRIVHQVPVCIELCAGVAGIGTTEVICFATG